MSARRRDASPMLVGALVALGSMVPSIATAQPGRAPAQPKEVATATGVSMQTVPDAPAGSATANPAAQVDVPAAAAETADGEKASSTETGQSPLDESFAPRTHEDWVRETRRKAWEDTTFDIEFRTFYLDRDRYDGSESEAWAMGGSVGLKTGYFRERLALGATGYTSQRLYGPEDKDGTLLLQPGQHGYTVLGELYGEFLLHPHTRLSVGRRGYDTPYLNRSDVRMTPNTFEAIALQGLYGDGKERAEWRAGAGYFSQMKQRNSDEFVSMATVAGAVDGVERGVYVVGANYRKGNLSIGAINYYSDDIINIFHAESKYEVPLDDHSRLHFALQYSGQRSSGENLLRGTDFVADQWGGKAEFGVGGALFSTAYTRVRGDTDMHSPWGGYPGYTGVQVEDFNRAGEDAWMLRAAYNFPAVKGLSVYGLWVNGSDPDQPGQYAKEEVDFNLQWQPASGPLKGWLMRLRHAHVSQDDPATTSTEDLRVMVFYDLARP